MADFDFGISARDLYSAILNQLKGELRGLEANFANLSLQGQRTGRDVSAGLASMLAQMGPIKQEIASTTAAMATATAATQAFGASLRVAYSNVDSSSLKAATREIENQLAVTRQLGATASQFESTRSAQLQTRLSLIRAESDAMRRAAAEEARANAERFKFSQQTAPSSSLAERNSINKFTFDQETAGWERVAAAQKAATDSMIVNLKRFQAEETKADSDRFKFQQLVAPQSQIYFQRDAAGSLHAIDAALLRTKNGLTEVQNELGLNRIGFLELEAAGVNTLQALASGMNPFHVAVMESAQVMGALVQGGLIPSTSIVGMLKTAFVALISPIGLATAGAVTFAGGLGLVAYQAYQTDAALKQLHNTTLLQGRPASLVESNAVGMSRSMMTSGGIDRSEAQTAANELQRIPGISANARDSLSKVFEAFSLTQFNNDVEKAGEALTKVFSSTSAMKSFVDENKLLTGALKEQFDAAVEGDDIYRASGLAAEGLRDRLSEVIKVLGEARKEFGLLSTVDIFGRPVAPDSTAFAAEISRITKTKPFESVRFAEGTPGPTPIESQAEMAAKERLRTEREINVLINQRRDVVAAIEVTSNSTQRARLENTRNEIDRSLLTKQTPLQTEAHNLELLQIRETASARSADLQTQLQAQREISAATLKNRMLPFEGKGVDENQVEEMAKRTAAVQESLNKELAIHDQIRDEKTASTLAGINAQIAAESQGSAAKIALTQQAIDLVQQEINAGHKKEAELAALVVQRTTYERQANQEAFNVFSRNADNRLSVAKGDWGAITGIIEEWKQKAKEAFKDHAEDFAREMEGIEKKGISAYKNLVSIALTSAASMRSANQDILSSFQRGQDTRVRDMGAVGTFAAPSALQESISKTRELETINRQVLENVMKQADAIGDAAQQTQVYWDLWRLGTQTQSQVDALLDKQSQAQKSITQAVQETQLAQLKQNEALAQARGDLAAIVELRREEAALINANKDSTAAQKINAETGIIQAQVQAQQQSVRASQQAMESANRFANDRLQTNKALMGLQIAQGNMTREEAIRSEMKLTAGVMAQQQARAKAYAESTNLTVEQRAAANEKLASLYEQDAQKQIELQTRLTETIQRENEQRLQHVKGFFESTGSAMGDLLIAGLTKSQTKEQALKQFANSIITSFTKEAMGMASQFAGKGLASVLGVNLKEGEDSGIGSVLAKAVGSMLGITKPEPANPMAQVAPKLELAASAHKEAAALLSKSAQELSASANKAPYSGGAAEAKPAPTRTEIISEAGKSTSNTNIPSIPNSASGAYGVPGAVMNYGSKGGLGTQAQAAANLTTVTSASGASFRVNAEAAPAFKGFIDDLESSGYKIDSKQSGGYNNRTIAGSNTLSEHAFGNAVDINWQANPQGKSGSTDLPANVGDMAAKHGLIWGGNWPNKPDRMHFQWGGKGSGASNTSGDYGGGGNTAAEQKTIVNDNTSAEEKYVPTAAGRLRDQGIYQHEYAKERAFGIYPADDEAGLGAGIDPLRSSLDQLGSKIGNQTSVTQQDIASTAQLKSDVLANTQATASANQATLTDSQKSIENSITNKDNTQATKDLTQELKSKQSPAGATGSTGTAAGGGAESSSSSSGYGYGKSSKGDTWTDSSGTNPSNASINASGIGPNNNEPSIDYTWLKGALLREAIVFEASPYGAKNPDWAQGAKTIDIMKNIPERNISNNEYQLIRLQSEKAQADRGGKSAQEHLFPEVYNKPYIKEGVQIERDSRINALQNEIQQNSQVTQSSSNIMQQSTSNLAKQNAVAQQNIQATQQDIQATQKGVQNYDANSQATDKNSQAVQANTQALGQKQGGGGAGGGSGGGTGGSGAMGDSFGVNYDDSIDYGGGGNIDGIDYGGGGYLPSFAEGTSDSSSSGGFSGGNATSLTSAFSSVSGASSSLSSVLGVAANASSLFGNNLSETGNKFLQTTSLLSSVMSMLGGMGGGGGGGGILGGIFGAVGSIFGPVGSIIGKIGGSLLGSAFAGGTSSTPRGTILVGEKGPELIHQPGGLGVLPAGPTRALLRQMHSAAKGMVVGESPTLTMLHPREMVLPEGISFGLQNMISRGDINNNSGTSNFNYNANVTGYHPYATRSSFEGMLREHGTTMQNWAEGIIRNQSLSRAHR